MSESASIHLTAPTRGFIYVAWGTQFVKEAIRSALSVKQYMDYPIVLITPSPIQESHPFDQVICTPFEGTYRDKIKMVQSPFEETIFLDTDTYVLHSFDPVFDLLKRFDLAYQPSGPSNHYTLPGLPELAFDEPSAGLVAWRANGETRRFFEVWDAEYSIQEAQNGNGAWDQRSMRAAVWNTDVRFAPLRADWQLCSFEFAILMNTAKMVHGRGKDAEAAISQCNRFIGPRLYAPRLGVTRAWRIGPNDYLRLSVLSFRMAANRFLRLLLDKTGIWRLPKNKRPA
jgi:hypothetical protein